MIRLGVVASAAVLAGAGAVWAGETDCGEARLVWADVKDSGSATAIENFAQIYADCPIYSQLARDLLVGLTGEAPAPAKADAPRESQRRLRVSDLRPRPELDPDAPPQDPDYSDGEYECLMAAAAPGQSPYVDGVKWADMDAQNAMAICADLLLNDQGVDAEVVAAFGRALMKGGKLEMALEFSELAAMEGSGLAMNTLATLYGDGEIVPEDVETAFAWYMAAAETGLPMGMHNVAHGYENGKGVARDIDRALYYYERAAFFGYEQSLLRLGTFYREGTHVTRDMQRAVDYLKMAARNGSTDAAARLGYIYETGENGYSKDIEQALYYYFQAARQDNVVALHNLGALTYHGRDGVPQDTEAAFVFWGRAAKLGDMKSQRKFGRLLYEIGEVEEALRFLRLAAGQGDDEAQELIRQIEGG
ncbi:TPR repeat [Ruegeria intermedia]|uniref:TPR repeat n=1 Tax=Ruegeria intermedia TaxID=996115 RepID=A0A1M5BAX6_9RHOB|nr:tetratricopeptide repeat protein [Ruegeria intermedia]SHF39654.1 TPR repeat [Ruegeria intermedia]